jgi:membrane associated rhomboid family serine protease
MRSAAVGFQCPDDVAAGARSVRQPRTAFGGRLSGDTSRVSIALIGINLAVFVLGLLAGQGELRLRFANLAGPVLISADEVAGVADGEYYRLITAAFLHAGLLHLAMNMFALASLGPVLESALGRSRFLVLYLVSALGGSTLSFLLAQPNTVGVGASGAIFGLFGAFYVVARRLGGDTRSILTLLVINLVITFAVPIIDWRAHLGGLITGTLVAAAFAFAPRGPRRTAVQAAACVAVVLLLLVLVAVRSRVLTG